MGAAEGAGVSGWKLKRVRQCAKCPWKVSTDPYEIPDGYSVEAHRALACTIASPGDIRGGGRAMSCHEHLPEDEAHCIGWLMNQLGPGNNIGLRLRMLSCENIRSVRLDGPQHERFEDTLPSEETAR
ncbi:hypothetical protein CNY89_00155 [Amaricoccus sp. HAR-UPW-R2A-40]|nr:hypothetical protein CNY89_00155 [Amaricoccus sp. HAR-UPW-R2A-40]